MDSRFLDGRMLDRTAHRGDGEYWTDSSKWGIVTSAHYRATEAGVDVLSLGGNAVDAAVAVSLALGVVEPAGSGLGGMGMMMVHLAGEGRTFILEGPCRAPVRAAPEDILRLAEEFKKSAPKALELTDEEIAGLVRKSGYKSIALPTNAAVLGFALANYGSLQREAVFSPALRLAEDGYTVTPFQEKVMRGYRSQIRKGNASGFVFGGQDDSPAAGTLIRQPVLARTLSRLSEKGFEDFYTGAIGMEIVEDMKRGGGFISEDDMKEVPWPRETEPVAGTFNAMEVMSMPPPGGGNVLIEMLNLFEAMGVKGFDPDSPEGALLLAYIIGRARLDRRESFTRKSRRDLDLTSKEYARRAAGELLDEMGGDGETTHFNIIDRHGNVVAMTQSIERSFGSKMAAPSLGFLYNGFMKAFKLRSRKHPHYLRPGAVARSNASPTIVFRDGRPLYSLGSTGSERMVSGMFQVLLRLMSRTPFEAVMAPRLHVTPERQVFLEAERFDPEAIDLLRSHGFGIMPYDAWAFSVGGLHLAGISHGECWGVAEPRRDGAAAGPLSEPHKY